eukprot:1962072-Rhodomonas_salina.1
MPASEDGARLKVDEGLQHACWKLCACRDGGRKEEGSGSSARACVSVVRCVAGALLSGDRRHAQRVPLLPRRAGRQPGLLRLRPNARRLGLFPDQWPLRPRIHPLLRPHPHLLPPGPPYPALPAYTASMHCKPLMAAVVVRLLRTQRVKWPPAISRLFEFTAVFQFDFLTVPGPSCLWAGVSFREWPPLQPLPTSHRA